MRNCFSIPFVLLLFLNGWAQEVDPQLFRTWNLVYVKPNDFTSYYMVNVTPVITPTLTILDDFSFFGEAACNSFEGLYYTQQGSDLQLNQFMATTEDCGVPIHNSVELALFQVLQNANSYDIFQTQSGLALLIYAPTLMGIARFNESDLNIIQNSFVNKVIVTPNPANSEIEILHENLVISKIEFFNTAGQKLMRVDQNFSKIQIGELPTGLYNLKIYTDSDILYKRLLKY